MRQHVRRKQHIVGAPLRQLAGYELVRGGAIVGGGLPSSELPLVMSIDGAWECRAGVLYQVKHSRKFESGVRLVDAEPTPGVGTSIRRLRSVVSLEAMANSPSGAMDGVSTLMDELSMY